MSTWLTFSIYNVLLKGEGSNLGEKSRSPQYLGVVAIEKGAFGSPLTRVGQLTDHIISTDSSHLFEHS